MRLFVAIDLDHGAREAIAGEQKRVARQIVGTDNSALSLVPPERMHLTLLFLGEVPAMRSPRGAADRGEPDDVRGPSSAAVIEAMHDDMDGVPFGVAFAGLGVFPSRGAPRVLWVGVANGRREIMGIQRQIADRFVRLGASLEDRAYHPHLTLARWRAARPADRHRALAADSGGEVARIDVAAVTLYQSRLSSSGPTYTALASAPLRP